MSSTVNDPNAPDKWCKMDVEKVVHQVDLGILHWSQYYKVSFECFFPHPQTTVPFDPNFGFCYIGLVCRVTQYRRISSQQNGIPLSAMLSFQHICQATQIKCQYPLLASELFILTNDETGKLFLRTFNHFFFKDVSILFPLCGTSNWPHHGLHGPLSHAWMCECWKEHWEPCTLLNHACMSSIEQKSEKSYESLPVTYRSPKVMFNSVAKKCLSVKSWSKASRVKKWASTVCSKFFLYENKVCGLPKSMYLKSTWSHKPGLTGYYSWAWLPIPHPALTYWLPWIVPFHQRHRNAQEAHSTNRRPCWNFYCIAGPTYCTTWRRNPLWGCKCQSCTIEWPFHTAWTVRK